MQATIEIAFREASRRYGRIDKRPQLVCVWLADHLIFVHTPLTLLTVCTWANVDVGMAELRQLWSQAGKQRLAVICESCTSLTDLLFVLRSACVCCYFA